MTPTQGQYLAFICAYARVLGRPPAEADLQENFTVNAADRASDVDQLGR
jgi:hypothetical protein